MRTLTFIGILFILWGCQDDTIPINPIRNLPYGEAWPDIYIKDFNILTEDRITLGRHLFYDTRLSSDLSLSCSNCHLQTHAFSDTVAISPGVYGRLGFRNSPSLMNSALVDRAHKDKGVNSIDLQALTPIEDHVEMDIRIAEVVDRLADDSYLQTLSQTAYGRPISEYSIILGLATFVKSLVSVDSRYDAYINGSATFTQEEKNGLALFNQHCASCHPAPYFGSNDIANNGTKTDYQHDLGRMRVTGDPSDEGKFRIPSLRNITLTYPYMHDGSFETIYAVLEHYNTGGTNHHNQDESVKPLNLSKGDLDALSAFLHTLTDNSIATNPALANPW